MNITKRIALISIVGACSVLAVSGCAPVEAEEPRDDLTTQMEAENSEQEEYLAQLADILESDLTYYDNFSPASKRFDCGVTLSKDSLFKRFSPESEDCIDWMLGFTPVVERLNTRLSLLPELEDPQAERIKTLALSESETFLRTLTCTDGQEWSVGEKFGERCADMWSAKGDALDQLVSQRSSTWYAFIEAQS